MQLGVLTMAPRSELAEHLEGEEWNEYGSRWVFTVKEDEGKQFLKARLVCQGFDEVVESHLDAPT